MNSPVDLQYREESFWIFILKIIDVILNLFDTIIFHLSTYHFLLSFVYSTAYGSKKNWLFGLYSAIQIIRCREIFIFSFVLEKPIE